MQVYESKTHFDGQVPVTMAVASPYDPVDWVDTCIMIKIWRFNSAPSELRTLFKGTGQPEWIMQIPLSLAKDLKEDFVSAWEAYSYKGTMIYFGAAKSMGVLMSEAALGQDDSRE